MQDLKTRFPLVLIRPVVWIVLNLSSWLMNINAVNLIDVLGIFKRTLSHWEQSGNNFL